MNQEPLLEPRTVTITLPGYAWAWIEGHASGCNAPIEFTLSLMVGERTLDMMKEAMTWLLASQSCGMKLLQNQTFSLN